jgi:hypothetical protein
MMELQTLHNSPATPIRRGKAATYAASPHGRLVLMLGLAIVSIVCLSLIGCSGQRDAQMRDAQQREALASDLPSPSDGMDYDPWEKINDKTFYFNFNLADHYAIKPAAKVWSRLPEQFRQGLANAFYNLDMPKAVREQGSARQAARRWPGAHALCSQHDRRRRGILRRRLAPGYRED